MVNPLFTTLSERCAHRSPWLFPAFHGFSEPAAWLRGDPFRPKQTRRVVGPVAFETGIVMESRRSYPDAGRVSRPQMTLDQLNRSLEQLERQLQQRGAQRLERETLQNQRRLAEAGPYHPNVEGFDPKNLTLTSLDAKRTGDPVQHRVRSEEASIAEELAALRLELTAELNDVRQEHADRDSGSNLSETVRGEAHQPSAGVRTAETKAARAAQTPSIEVAGMRSEIERLTDAVQALAKRTDDRPINVLRLELEQARAAMEPLAREDSVRSIGARWDEFERRMNVLQETIAAESRGGSVDAGVEGSALKHRLDEISRAISASTASASTHLDPEQFRRIEARIVALSNQIDALSEGAPLGEAYDRLDSISRRVDAIGTRLDKSLPAVSETDTLGAMELRLADLAQRIEALHSVIESSDDSAVIDAIDTRFADLASRLEAMRASDEAILGLEHRLSSVITRLDDQGERAYAGLDPSLVGSLEAQIVGLSQFLARTDVSDRRIDALGPRLDRLEETVTVSREAAVETAREAAERAVQMLTGAPRSDVKALAGLADDLKELQNLTKRSDERNARTFEAIHDTLLKIVHRLGSVEESNRAGVFEAPQRVLNGIETSSTDALASQQRHVPEDAVQGAVSNEMADIELPSSPAEATVAVAAMSKDSDMAPILETAVAKRSVLRGLSRAFSRKQSVNKEIDPPSVKPADPDTMAAPIELHEPLDPNVANRPLEPGSGAPDLNAIIKRVRDERTRPERPFEADAATSDFIAAARRAAQAAAAESDILKRGAGTGNSGGALKAYRKPILLACAAVMIAIAGFQLSKPQFLAATGLISTEVDPAPPGGQGPTPAATKPTAEKGASTVGHTKNESASEVMQAAALKGSAMEVAPQESAAISTSAAESKPDVAASEVPADAGPVALRVAAQSGDSKALFEVAARYAEGRGVGADLAQAATWYEKSADAGFAPAQYRIGNMYEKGNGVTRDLAKAKTWYQLAANKGNAAAMHNLAVLLAMGAEGVTDGAAAARWFTAAANLGVKDSQFNLGILAAKGAGVRQSLEESYKWFALVAKTGDKDAAAKRDEIARAMRPEQLARARSAVEAWQPGKMDAEANKTEIPKSWRDGPTTTASIDMERAVRNVQSILNSNGYDAGDPDGVMGARTTEAIKAFQKDNGLQPTGSVDKALVEALLARR